MSFVEKNKKWLFLLSAGCFIISMLNALVGGIQLVFSGFGAGMHWVGIIELVLNSCNVIMEAVLIIVLLVTAIVYWIKGKGKLFLVGSGVIMLICWGLSLLSQLVFLLLYADYNIGILLRNVADSVWIPIFSAYLIVFSFLKPKGLSVPILGAALILFMLSGRLAFDFETIVYYVESRYFLASLEHFLRFIGDIADVILSSVYYLGLFLLVPFALYAPKKTVEPEKTTYEDSI